MIAPPKSKPGRTGLTVTKLGDGAMELRGTDHFPRLSPTEASAILNGVLDSGINYIDTSPDYGYPQELIGRAGRDVQRQRTKSARDGYGQVNQCRMSRG